MVDLVDLVDLVDPVDSVVYSVGYGDSRYTLAKHMEDLPLFKLLIQSTGETLFTFTSYKEEFIQLNQQTYQIKPNQSPDYYNRQFIILNYFTADRLLAELYQIIQQLEYGVVKSRICQMIKTNDFDLISLKYPITDEYIAENHLYINFRLLVQNPHVSDQTLMSLMKYIPLFADMKGRSEAVRSAYVESCLARQHLYTKAIVWLLNNYRVPLWFIKAHINAIHDQLSDFYQVQNLDEKFYEEYHNVLLWFHISTLPLSESFFRRNWARVNRETFSTNLHITSGFFLEYLPDLHPSSLCANQSLNDGFYRLCPTLDYSALAVNPSVTWEFIEERLRFFDISLLCSRQDIPDWFLYQHAGTRLDCISWNPCAKEDFLKRHRGALQFKYLAFNQSITDQFIRDMAPFRYIHMTRIYRMDRAFDILLMNAALMDGAASRTARQVFNASAPITDSLSIDKFVLVCCSTTATEEMIVNCIGEYQRAFAISLLKSPLRIPSGITIDFYNQYSSLIPICLTSISIKKEVHQVDRYAFNAWKPR